MRMRRCAFIGSVPFVVRSELCGAFCEQTGDAYWRLSFPQVSRSLGHKCPLLKALPTWPVASGCYRVGVRFLGTSVIGSRAILQLHMPAKGHSRSLGEAALLPLSTSMQTSMRYRAVAADWHSTMTAVGTNLPQGGWQRRAISGHRRTLS